MVTGGDWSGFVLADLAIFFVFLFPASGSSLVGDINGFGRQGGFEGSDFSGDCSPIEKLSKLSSPLKISLTRVLHCKSVLAGLSLPFLTGVSII